MYRFSILLVVLWGALAQVSFAAEPLENGFFIGGSAGVSEFDDDGAFNGASFDDGDSAFGINGGYKFFKHFAVEARYTDTGTFTLSGLGGSVDIDTDVISVHAVGIIPFGASGWSIYGQLGLGIVGLDASGAFNDDDDETVGSAGLGVSYNATENLSLALQIDAYAWEDDSEDYDLAITTSQLVVRYTF
jgi:hypothetical protein